MGTGRRLEVAGHLTVMELFERYRGAEDAALKAHLQVIWLKAQGWQTREVARSTGFKTDWVRRLVRRYNEHGPGSLGDRRASNGREPLFSEAQRQELLAALGKPAITAGCGRARRWRGGSGSGSDARCDRSGAGSTCATWG